MAPLTDELADLLARARKASEAAYVPYSGFRVGAALLFADGTVVTGCNVENASYGLTLCAERNACTTAVAQGRHQFEAVAIHVDGPDGQPCGACRQFLHEFAPDAQVVYLRGGEPTVSTLGELLPDGFVPESLNA